MDKVVAEDLWCQEGRSACIDRRRYFRESCCFDPRLDQLTFPQTSEYYDSLSEGSKITLDGPEVFSALEGVYQHSLTPKTAHPPFEWGSHGATMTLISLSVGHFLLFVALI